MADIYRNCEKCLMFIGNTSEDDAKRLQELLKAFSKKHHFDQPDAPRINSMFGISRLSVMYLNRRDWWECIWVVQVLVVRWYKRVVSKASSQTEVGFPFWDPTPGGHVGTGVPRRLWAVRNALLGTHQAVEFLDEHDIGSAWGPSRHETDDLCHCMDSIKITFIRADLLALRDHVYRLLELGRPQSRPDANTESVPLDPGDIVDVLLSVRHRDCTDPRDKIFGVLSLVQDWGSWSPIKADYSGTALQVFTEFAT
jgi:hypothetical protein